MLRRTYVTVLFVAVLSLLASPRDARAQDTTAAEVAATAWLAHVDSD